MVAITLGLLICGGLLFRGLDFQKSSFMTAPLFLASLVDPQNAAHEVVKEFCEAEFGGDDLERRRKIITFSEKVGRQRAEKSFPVMKEVVQWNWDPFDVVVKYEIVDVKVEGKKGFASITYTKVAHSLGEDKIIADPLSRVDVLLDLAQHDDGWKIVDPPIPKISLVAITRLYEIRARGGLNRERPIILSNLAILGGIRAAD